MKIIVLFLFLPTPAFACSQDSFGPCLYAPDGTYLGSENNQSWDPNSINNPNGRYGSPYGAPNTHSPTSPYGNTSSPMSPNFQKNPYSEDPSQRPDWGTAPGSKYSAPLGSGGGWGALGYALGWAAARREAMKRSQEIENDSIMLQEIDSIVLDCPVCHVPNPPETHPVAPLPLTTPGQVPAIDPDNKTVPANLPTLDAKDFGPPLPNTGR